MAKRDEITTGSTRSIELKRNALDHHLRRFAPADVSGILSVWESASEVAHAFLPEAFRIQEREDIQHRYLPVAETWVVEQHGMVIGFLSLLNNEIGGLFVRAEFHGTGAGTVLMDKAKQLHPVLDVEVFEKNLIGRKFYAKCGFRERSSRIHEESGNRLLCLRFEAGGQGS